MPASTSSIVRFGDLSIDLRTGELRKKDKRLRLQTQPFQVLELLLREPGELVTREELRKKLWSDNTFVDFEDGLNTAIRKLRQVLGDSTEHPRYIETLPRRGYRFIGRIEPQPTNALPEQDAAAQQHPAIENRNTAPALPAEVITEAREQSGKRAGVGRRRVVLVASAILVATAATIAVVGQRVGWRARALPGTARNAPIRSVAILPLENLSGDPNEEYFSDGITEQLITDLGKAGGLRVISHTSAMHYKGSRKTLPEIARELNVDAIVEGAVIHNQNRVRITAQLVRGSPEEHLWAESYERNATDLLDLQNEVAAAIAARILGKISPEQRAQFAAAAPINPEAYAAVMRARFYIRNRRSAEGARKALEYSLQATQLDGHSAVAYSALADSYAGMSFLGADLPSVAMPKAEAAAERALTLDPELGSAHLASGSILLIYYWNWRGAEREYKRALELNPSDSEAHGGYAEYLAAVGRLDEAVEEAKRARGLDPLSLLSNREVARILYYARRHEESLAELHQVGEMFPDSGVIYNWVDWNYQVQGLREKAVEADLENEQTNGRSTEVLAELRQVYKNKGPQGYWKKAVELALQGRAPIDPYELALMYIQLGNKKEALHCLEKAYQERIVFMPWVKVDPMLDPLREEPQFKGFLRHMGLAE
ncbi:MAG TPA: winged helix-turn-helix domain-containing protein [Candidatus Angelobacter sp.]|nr:winged helix-turn-helix domain-containing protein [Candidatus Angelobacter sp.]